MCHLPLAPSHLGPPLVSPAPCRNWGVTPWMPKSIPFPSRGRKTQTRVLIAEHEGIIPDGGQTENAEFIAHRVEAVAAWVGGFYNCQREKNSVTRARTGGHTKCHCCIFLW